MMVRTRLHIKNMSCICCVRLATMALNHAGINVVNARLGEIDVEYEKKAHSLRSIVALLEAEGFEMLYSREEKIVEQIKNAVIDLVHHSTYNAMVRNSDYLVERFNLSYQRISTIFSQHMHITLEKYIIQQRIEKVKELINEGDLTLSEIAFMMGYSSVQYLSTQFKSITGISVSDFKKNSSVGSAVDATAAEGDQAQI